MRYQEQLVIGLRALGYVQSSTRSKKYLAFYHPDWKSKHSFFLGVNGSLRKGPTVSASVSIGTPSHQDIFYRKVLQAAADTLAGGEKKVRESDVILNQDQPLLDAIRELHG